MSSKKVTISGGSVLCSAVFIVFLVLKLAEVGVVAKWSWWWVFAPLWVPVAIGLAIVIFAVVVYLISKIVKKRR